MKNTTFSPIQTKNINRVKRILTDNPKGLTIDEINQESGLAISIIQTVLELIKDQIVYDEVENSYAIAQLATTPANEPTKAGETEQVQEIKPKRTMFSPTALTGFQIKGENIRIFLDKRHNAQSITLSVNDLKDLLKSVKRQGLKNVG